MGPGKYRGMNRGGGAPTSPDSGSGGAGVLGGATVGPFNVGPAVSEIGDVTTGRITLGLINLTILGMIAFYLWSRSAQGGG